MYKISDPSFGTFIAFSIPHGVSPDLKSETLRRGHEYAHAILERDSLLPFINAVVNATPEELELARPQIGFLLSEIRKEAMKKHRIMHLSNFKDEFSLIKDKKTGKFHANIGEMVVAASKHIEKDAKSALETLKKSPTISGNASMLVSILETYAETSKFMKMYSDYKPEFKTAADAISRSFEDALNKSMSFMDSASNIYPNIAYPASRLKRVMENAEKAVDREIKPIAFIQPRHFRSLEDDTGTWEQLRGIGHLPLGEKRNEMARQMGYQPLTTSKGSVEVEAYRNRVVNLLRAYEDAYNTPGIIPSIREGLVTLVYEHLDATDKIDHDVEHVEDDIRRGLERLRSGYRISKEEYERDLAKIPETIQRMKEEGRSKSRMLAPVVTALTNDYIDFMKFVKPELRTEAEIILEVEGENTVGYNDLGIPVFAIYPDSFVDVDGAVFGIKLEPGVLENGKAPEEMTQSLRDSSKGSNFWSMEGAISEIMSSDFAQKHFFGESVRFVDKRVYEEKSKSGYSKR